MVTIQSGYVYLVSKGPTSSDEATITETTITNNGIGFTIVIVPTKATPVKVISEKMDKEKPFPTAEEGTFEEKMNNTAIFNIGKQKDSFDIHGVLKLKDIDGTVINDYNAICSRTDENNLEKYLNTLRRLTTMYFVRGDSRNWEKTGDEQFRYECSLMKFEITYKGSDVGIMAPGSSTIDMNQADVHLLLVRAKEMGK